MRFGSNLRTFPILGVQVWVIRARTDGSAISREDVEAIKEAFQRSGTPFSTKLKVEPVFGPNGRTPIVMENKQIVIGADGKPVPDGPCNVHMSFSSHEAAVEARKYIDSSFYKIGNVAKEKDHFMVTASWLGPDPGIGSEWDMFDTMAKNFGGKVDWVGFSGE